MEDLGVFLFYFISIGMLFSGVALYSSIVAGKQAEENFKEGAEC